MSHYDELRREQQEADDATFLRDALAAMAEKQRERLALVDPAHEALRRLVGVCANRSGQSYKLRSLLWSLYSGKPTSLIECLGLDWNLRKDFAAVLLAFGFEHPKGSFFYHEIKSAFSSAGLRDWFFEEADVEGGSGE